MSKTRVLSIIVIVLILLNIGLMAVFIFNKPPHPRHFEGNGGPKQIIIERLHFDEEQITAYEDLINEHREDIETKEIQLREAKEKLYALLATDNQANKTILINKINSIQKEIEENHYNHFLEIKKLCNADQLNDFNDLSTELARLFSPHPKPPRR